LTGGNAQHFIRQDAEQIQPCGFMLRRAKACTMNGFRR